MRYHALAIDYDGTLTSTDKLSPVAVMALERLRASGRRAILVTGRRLEELLPVFSEIMLFDYVVAENGGVAYEPRTREETLLAASPQEDLIGMLRERGVEPLEVGKVVIATWEPFRAIVADAIRNLGLELQIICNRAAVMVLPPGVNKALGLEHALRKFGLSRHELVGIGDAENDHSFLDICECAVAVNNAVASIKESVAFVTREPNGQGVAELVDELLADDLQRRQMGLRKHFIALGTRDDGSEVSLSPYGRNLLVAGPSGSGKSTFTAGLLERLREKAYQVCIVDPEGDYGTLRDVVALGNASRAASIDEILSVLEEPASGLSINLLGIPIADRPDFLAQLIPNLQALRARTGRPHWVVLDEAHHMLPPKWGPAAAALPRKLTETILVTVHPDRLAPAVLEPMDIMVAVGPTPEQTLQKFAQAIGQRLVWPEGLAYQPGRVVIWFAREGIPPFAVTPRPGHAERIRHRRKYADGNMRWNSFYFKGPDGRHNLRAQNLAIFCQIADGIDEATWLFHLRRGDYSRWFRSSIKDGRLADETELIEQRRDLSASQTRELIRGLVESRYTLPE
jgi:HAD superfamily hydrolase (TIGR01484 family)